MDIPEPGADLLVEHCHHGRRHRIDPGRQPPVQAQRCSDRLLRDRIHPVERGVGHAVGGAVPGLAEFGRRLRLERPRSVVTATSADDERRLENDSRTADQMKMLPKTKGSRQERCANEPKHVFLFHLEYLAKTK